jgi:hypothetical protein
MQSAPFSAFGKSFSIHEWRGSGPATLHVHRSDDEAWHVLEGELTFRYADRVEIVGAGTTVFVPAGVAHTYSAGVSTRYLIILTPRLSALIGAENLKINVSADAGLETSSPRLLFATGLRGQPFGQAMDHVADASRFYVLLESLTEPKHWTRPLALDPTRASLAFQ